MPPDFVARLGSRASDPTDVRSGYDVGEYVRLTAGNSDLDARLKALAYDDAPRLRRVDPDRLLALVTAMARPPTAELNKARLAAVAGIPATTVSPYIELVELLGIVRMLPGASWPYAKRAVARPRVVFAEPAMARHLSGVAAADLVTLAGRSRLAPLLEGLAIVELMKQQQTSSVEYRVSHLRERNGLEVDVLIELPDETLYGVEIRTASAFRPHQFRALEALAVRAGSRFRGGIVLNTAPVGVKYRPGMWVLPISALWDWGG